MPPPNKPRSLVGKLLARIKGRDTSAPVTQVAGDPAKAIVYYTRLRDAKLVADQQKITLGGQFNDRRQAIVTEIEAERYEQAGDLLDALDRDLEAEQQLAVRRLKDEFGPLRLRVAQANRSTSSSPTVANIVKAVGVIVDDIEGNIKGKVMGAALAALNMLTAQLNALDKQLAKDKDAYDKLALQLKGHLDGLTAPVVTAEVRQARATSESARQKADGGDAYGALVLATQAVKECQQAAQLRDAYEQALAQAQNTLQTQLGNVFPLDTERIQADFINAAKDKAKAGERQAALALLAKVAAECNAAKGVRDASPFDADSNRELADFMAALLKHPQRAAFKAEIDALNQRYTRAKANQSLSKAAHDLFSEVYWECNRLKEQADLHGTYLTRQDTVLKPKVGKLRTDGPPDTVQALEAEISAVELKFAKAGRQAAKHLYELARAVLDDVEQDCDRVVQLKADHVRYAALRKEVTGILDGLKDTDGTAFEIVAKRMGGRLSKATTLSVTDRQFAEAAQLLETLKTEAQALALSVTAQSQAKADVKKAAADPAKVQELLERLKGHAGKAGAKSQIETMERLLKEAAKATGSAATDLLKRAGDGYVPGLENAELHARLEHRIKSIVEPGKAELDGSEPAIATQLQRINKQIEDARSSSLAQDHAQSTQSLEGAITLIAQARKMAVDIDNCAKRFTALKTVDVSGLTTHALAEQDPVIGKEIKALNKDLEQIDQAIKGRDYEGALRILDRTEVKCQQASIKKKVAGGGLSADQMTEQCKQLASRAGGQAALDELVENFKGGQSVDAVLAAMKARFKLDDAECLRSDGDDQAKVTQELCALYSTMTKVPAKHTRDNPSFKKIVRKAERGSAYNSGQKAIKMGEGHPDRSAEYPVGNGAEVPDVDDNCKPNAKAKAVKFFDWNTWHEVGHAMDDRKQFMNKRAGQAQFGGWQTHKGDVMAVAEAVAADLNPTYPAITAAAVAKYLDSGVGPLPHPTGWNKVIAWAQAVKHDQDPWAQGAKCTTGVAAGGFLVGDRVYHEGYKGQWFSYLAAARKQGVTGYQFRAPGEWFSELYAAYKSNKLNSSHPARSWLGELFNG